MECREAFFAIQRHYDGELTSEEQQMLDQHLLTCADCQQEFDEYGDFFGDVACLTLQVEHRDVLSHTLERIEEASRKRRMDIWWRASAVAASFVVITSTAFFSLSETGSRVGSQVAAIFQDSVLDPAVSTELQAEEIDSTLFVEDDPQAAAVALQEIRQQVAFPLLELQDDRLTLVSTYMLDQKMVDLTYKVHDNDEANADTIYFVATTEKELIQQSRSNLGVYQFNDSVQAGNFLWSTVGEHALRAEINNVIYQLYSPFLGIEELRGFAAKLKKLEP